ncbi:MAG: hypothetical protein NZT92_20795, partial [Abditibacteriales bacterium]|nr:hypothetical protein [Abditibacteriales bacterium]MDW8367319.1 hypothetical protein [Abditibacteriales bacterium]
EGRIDNLRHLKEDVNEIPAGMECGVAVRNFNDFQVGDLLQSIELVEVRRSLDGRRTPTTVGAPTRR